MHGLTNGLEVKRIATKFGDKFNLKAEAYCKELSLDGIYKMTGQMLILPINGKGKLKVTQKQVTGILSLKGDFFEKDGFKYLNATSFTLKLKPKTTSYFLENVFNGDKQLSDTINNFMNESWQEVNNILLPEYFRIISDRFLNISNEIFNNIPFDLIFPK